MSKLVVGHIWVFMADNEWSSHRNYKIMEELAVEYRQRHATEERVQVQVYEHGGWSHTYYFGPEAPDGHRLFTANDSAPLSERSKEIMATLKGAETKYLGSYRRTVEEAGDSK